MKVVRYGFIDRYLKQQSHIGKPPKKGQFGHKDYETSTGADEYYLAPASRGYYAMPFGYEEPYLLGGIEKKPGPIADAFKWAEKHEKREKEVWKKCRHIVDIKGSVWCRLDGRVNVLQRKGDWILADVDEIEKSLKRIHFYLRKRWCFDNDIFELFVDPHYAK
jgi:hypothetical protein